MILKLWDYFGWVGLASIVAWGAAAVLLVYFGLSPRRTAAYRAAAALAVLGLLLAGWNSRAVSAIGVDPRFEQERLLEQARQRRQALAEELSGQAANIAFAEDAIEDRLDLAGVTDQGALSEYERAIRQAQEAQGELLRPRRRADRSDGAEPERRLMDPADVARANRADVANLFLARSVLLAALLGLVGDYLARFNGTFAPRRPLPLAGRTLDRLASKTHAVYLETDDLSALERYLRLAVAKGETYLYCGPDAPLPGGVVWRVNLGGLVRWGPIEHLRPAAANLARDLDDLLPALWFGQACASVTDEDLAQWVLAELTDRLALRRQARAAAARTVHLVWAFPAARPAADLAALTRLCRAVNFKLLLAAPRPPDRATARHFEEYLRY